MNHSLLCALGVGHPILDKIKGIANEFEMGCKITGGGGGGCLLVLAGKADEDLSVKINDFKLRLEQIGCRVIEAPLGVDGVAITEISEWPSSQSSPSSKVLCKLGQDSKQNMLEEFLRLPG